MINHKVQKNLLVGAAIAAGILGTVRSLLRNNKKFKEISFAQEKEHINKKMILGGMAGGVVAAATALLLAPKSGAELIKEIYGPFSKFFKRSREKVLAKTGLASPQKKRPARLKAKSLDNRKKVLSQKGKEALLITKKKAVAKAAPKKSEFHPN